jgi:hypothetical protein
MLFLFLLVDSRRPPKAEMYGQLFLRVSLAWFSCPKWGLNSSAHRVGSEPESNTQEDETKRQESVCARV